MGTTIVDCQFDSASEVNTKMGPVGGTITASDLVTGIRGSAFKQNTTVATWFTAGGIGSGTYLYRRFYAKISNLNTEYLGIDETGFYEYGLTLYADGLPQIYCARATTTTVAVPTFDSWFRVEQQIHKGTGQFTNRYYWSPESTTLSAGQSGSGYTTNGLVYITQTYGAYTSKCATIDDYKTTWSDSADDWIGPAAVTAIKRGPGIVRY